MNNYERVQKSIDFMEEHLAEPVTLEEIAGVTHFSLPHFYRLFNALVGRTIKDYLRLRRLSEAAKQVATGTESILEIALQYQFGSQESFGRAFREAWGVNPSEVRKSGQHPELLWRSTCRRRDHLRPRWKLTCTYLSSTGRKEEAGSWTKSRTAG